MTQCATRSDACDATQYGRFGTTAPAMSGASVVGSDKEREEDGR